MPLRILIADDSRVVRKSLHGLLEQYPEWMVCAEAVDGADAIDKAQQFRPDVIILDFFMPRMTDSCELDGAFSYCPINIRPSC
jgi:chemotaxis response regulator CheB